MYLSPQVLGLLSSAAVNVVKSIPAAQLAKFGLLRGTALAPLSLVPIAGAFVVGAAATVLAVPPARKWLFEQTSSLYSKAKGSMQEVRVMGANGASEQQAEPAHDGDAVYAQA